VAHPHARPPGADDERRATDLSVLAPHGWNEDPAHDEAYAAAPDLPHPLEVWHVRVPGGVSKEYPSYRSEPYIKRETRCPECGSGSRGYGLHRVYPREEPGGAPRRRGPVAELITLDTCRHAFRHVPGTRVTVLANEEPPL